MTTTYKTEPSGPAPLPWDDYAKIVRTEWQQLLDDPATGEPEIHDFLEKHPCLVPGHDAFGGAGPGNWPAGSGFGCVYSKPPLAYGMSKRIPDFMWIATDSQTQWAVLVEIEDPKKPWLTKSGQATAELTQAQTQVLEWQHLLKDPANKLQFMKMYGLPDVYPLEFIFCLVYGRRKDVATIMQANIRNSIKRPDIKWMTFDRLRPAEPTRDYMCVRVYDKEFRAVAVPATLKIELQYINSWRGVTQKSAATMASPHFDKQRQKFLAERFDYWDERLKKGDLGHYDPFDGE